jgi:putative protease
MEEIKVGVIERYFKKIGVAAIRLTDSALRKGDTIHIKGHTTDIKQNIDSMQIEHQSVESADIGDSIGIKVIDSVREGDIVYKVSD